jgi:hypothetical protein
MTMTVTATVLAATKGALAQMRVMFPEPVHMARGSIRVLDREVEGEGEALVELRLGVTDDVIPEFRATPNVAGGRN